MSAEISTAISVPRYSTPHSVKRSRSRLSRRLTISTSHVVKLAPSPPSPFSLAGSPQPVKPDGPESPAHVVLKFGGTSVAKCLTTIVDTITPSIRRSKKQIPIIVCSAQSYTMKTEGTTQCLLAAIDAALEQSDPSDPEYTFDVIKPSRHTEPAPPVTPPPTPPNAGSPTITAADVQSHAVEEPNIDLGVSSGPGPIISGILERHLTGAKKVLNQSAKDSEIFEGLERDLRSDCERISKILQAVSTLGEISPNMRDTVISFGELMACRTVVAALHSRSIPARLVDLTDLDSGVKHSPTSTHPNVPLDEKFFDGLVSRIGDRIRSLSKPSTGGSPVLVATGFFGPIPGSLLHNIGRGYTDVCAALCARAVAAEELQIWKEVDGVFSADPRKILNAQLLTKISSKHAKLLTSYGSEVVHHLAIDQTTYLDIPIVVKNVINPTAPGTRIITGSAGKSDTTIPSKKISSPPFAVTLLNDLEMVTVQFGDSFSGHPTLRVMDTLRTHLSDNATGLGLDLVNSSQENVCFMIKGPGSRDGAYEAGLRNALDALRLIATVTTTPGLSYLQAVLGSDPQRNSSIAWKMLGALADADVAIKVISHGAVEYGIGCVLPEKQAQKAASVVHDALLELLW